MRRTGSAYRWPSSLAKPRTVWLIPLSEPSALYGSPTTRSAGCQSRIRESTISQRGPAAVFAIPVSGLAVRLNVSPHATPIRRRPKSNAITSCGVASPRPCGTDRLLSIAADRADPGKFDAQQASGGMPTGFEGQVENDPGLNRGIEPGVRPNLILQLPAVPARVSQGDDCLLGSLAACHRGQNIPRRGDVNGVGDFQRRVPFAAGSMHDESAIRLHRAGGEWDS